jgi:hypothetical protein
LSQLLSVDLVLFAFIFKKLSKADYKNSKYASFYLIHCDDSCIEITVLRGSIADPST